MIRIAVILLATTLTTTKANESIVSGRYMFYTKFYGKLNGNQNFPNVITSVITLNNQDKGIFVRGELSCTLDSVMGCQIGVSKREKDTETLHLLSLPNEVLIKIMSFLQETRDRVTLRYVCRKLRNLCLTPSLWCGANLCWLTVAVAKKSV